MSARSVLRILALVRTNLDILDAFVDVNKLIKESGDRVDFLDKAAGEIAGIVVQDGQKPKSKPKVKSQPKSRK